MTSTSFPLIMSLDINIFKTNQEIKYSKQRNPQEKDFDS
jgi:hypothetical protein